MLRLLKRIRAHWNKPLPPPRYGAEISLEELARMAPPAMPSREKKAIERLLFALLTPLGESVASSLAKRATKHLEEGDTATSAVMECLGMEASGRHLAFSADIKWWGEVQWMANQVLEAYGVQATWSWSRRNEDRSVPTGLFDFGEWIEQHGYQLLHVDTGDDSVFAIPVKINDAALIRRLASEAGLPILTLEEARRQYGLED